MGEVMVVKTKDEDECDDADKAQVILQLQPITVGPDSTENDAAVLTVEGHQDQAEQEDVEICCPITCGDCKAMLLVKKFVCPGINVKCVKYEDQLISPKQFVHISGKATLKDWKRAIRMGGVMLRKMMDSGQLDFYQHSTLCTNTCRSTKFDILINNTRFPPDGTGLTTPTSSQTLGNGGVASEEVVGGKTDWSSLSLESTDRKESSEISEETLNFWKGIADVGLLGEVVPNISSELLELLNSVKQRNEAAAMQETDTCMVEAAVLSNLAQVFGLLDLVKKILERRRRQTDPSQGQVLSTLNSLELQLEEQRKQQEMRALLSCPQPTKSKSSAKRQPKRPRLQRPSSTTAATSTTTILASPVAQPAQQFTVLSPISLSSIGQPFTVASLAQSPSTLTLLPAGSQLFTRYMVAADGKADAITLHPSSGLTLVGAATATVQDPNSQLGTVVSPLELVHLSQQGGAVGEVVDGAMLVHGEVDGGHEHTVIEINPPPMEQQAVGVMELQLAPGEEVREGTVVVEQAMTAAGATQCHLQGAQAEEVQGLQLNANGQVSHVQIVVIGDASQGESQVK